jgi:tetratricopeptide (TPR) repeat protein
MRRVLDIQESQLGKQHPKYAFSLKNLATMLFEKGRVDEAIQSHRVAMEIESRTVGVHHPTYGHSLNFFGALLANQKRHSDAISAYHNAGRVFFAANGESDPGLGLVYVNLSHLYTETRDFDNAFAYHWKAIVHNETYKGPEHLDTATAHNNAACFYLMVGDGESARSLFEAALDIRLKFLGHEHHGVATLLGNLAMIAGRIGDPLEAETKFCEAFGISQRLGFSKWSDTCNLILNYLSFLERRGDWEQRQMIFSCLDSTCLGPGSLA